MKYLRLHDYLKEEVVFEREQIPLEGGMTVHNFEFESRHTSFLPEDGDPEGEPLDIPDSLVGENRVFSYPVFHPAGTGKSKGLILLFHGFNEKHWHKYLPWAARLVTLTGKSVVLFPIAFHMNRAPMAWSDSRLMHGVSKRRRAKFPELMQSSLVNAAISSRLQRNPRRFIWSGLQTFHDVRDFVEICRRGEHPLFAENPTVDILAYSIGAFLSEVLLLSNPDGLFSDTRLFMFCGGPVFNRISPVSRFILDSEANVCLYSFLVEHLESHLRRDAKLREHMSSGPGTAFRSMLSYQSMADFREKGFREMHSRLAAVALQGDVVIPPYEVENTLKGRARDIPVRVETLEFPYACKHEDPFPAVAGEADAVDESFTGVFEKAGEFFGS